MKHRSRWAAAILLAAFAVSNAAQGQSVVFPPGIEFPAATYQVVTTGPTTIVQETRDGRTIVTFSWAYIPPTPVPPNPGPGPGPTPIPPPDVFGPLARVLTLYESTELTGRGPMYSMTVVDALNDTVPADASTRVPNWRNWDRDLNPGASTDPNISAWVDVWTKAKLDYAKKTEPIMYAFDEAGRMKQLPLKDAKDVDVAAWIKALKTTQATAKKAA